jgi:phage host-nuclease inhibitor protein Gam
MKFALSNFPSVATNDGIEQEVLDLGDAEQLTAPLTESDQELASLIRHVGMTSIADIDQLIGELEEARDYLKSEEDRIRAETARYTALTQAASASVKIIFDAVRDWRKAGKSDRMQLSASRFEVTDAAKLDER